MNVEKFFIVSHIVCGASVLLVGLIQMMNRKGGKSHRILGRIYVGAMWWICISAWSIIIFYRFNMFLMVIAALTFYASFSGLRVLKRKTVGTEQWYDWVVAVLTALFGLGLVCFGGLSYYQQSASSVGVFLCLIFGFFTFWGAFQDLRFFVKKNPKTSLWWLRQHISAMGGSYIAAVTAFAVQNPGLFIQNPSYHWLLWILPSIIGNPILVFTIRKKMRSQKTYSTVEEDLKEK